MQFCANQPETLLAGTQFACFTGAKVQILALCAAEQLRASSSVTATRIYYSVYLLYWYKSTNTNAARRGAAARLVERRCNADLVLSLLALLVQKYKY